MAIDTSMPNTNYREFAARSSMPTQEKSIQQSYTEAFKTLLHIVKSIFKNRA